jgi:polar amino acid transport system substrate-binding protein
MMNALAKLVLAGVFATAVTAAAHADETVGYDEANAPFMFGENGQAKGLYPTLIEAAFARMSIPIKAIAEPWARVLKEVDDGKAGVGGLYRNAAREAKYDFSKPIFEEVLAVYVPAGKTFPFKSVDDLGGKTIGIIRGWSYGDAFDKAKTDGKFKVEEVDSDAINMRKLENGRIDALVAIPQSADAIVKSQNLAGKVAMLPQPLATNPTYLAFGKTANKVGVLSKFDETLAAMKADGSYEAIVKKAFGG